MEVDFQPSQELSGGLFEAVDVIPPAVAGQPACEVSPQTFNEVELRRIRGQPERLEAVRVLLPPGAQFGTLVIARVIKHDDERLLGRKRPSQLLQEGHERCLAFLRA